MNDIQSKAAHIEKLRKKIEHTWTDISPKLTLSGLVDEAAAQIVRQRRSHALVSVVAVAGVAWLFNLYLDGFRLNGDSSAKNINRRSIVSFGWRGNVARIEWNGPTLTYEKGQELTYPIVIFKFS